MNQTYFYNRIFSFLVIVLLSLNAMAFNHESNPHAKEINTFPYFEDFNSVTQPDLPAGWSSIVKSDNINAFVRTATIADPVTPPNHVRAFNSTDAAASLYLISPAITPNLNELRVRFFAKANSGSDNVIEVGTMDLGEDENFTMVQSITPGLTHTEYIVSLADYTGDHDYIAFRVVPGSTSRSIYIDNVLIDFIPTGPVAEVNPSSWDFGANQTGITWPEKEFTVTNVGIGTLTLEPADITITGDHASEFILNNLDAVVNLEPFESTTLGVSFSPQTVGDKAALLTVDNTEVPLSGEGFDNSITDFPHFMDFNDVEPPALPVGWVSHVESPNAAARVETTTLVNPVSPPNQLRFVPMNDPNATLIFISPPIGAPINTLRVSFSALGLNSAANSVQLGSYSVENGFTSIQSVNITSSHQVYQVDLAGYEGDDVLFAIKAISDPSTGRPTYLDNLNIALIPSEPTVDVSPNSWEFEPTHYGESSEEKEFTITNIGAGTLVLTAADISITGEDAADFTLNNLTETVELTANQSTTIGVVFTPELEGDKTASLMVKDFEVSLSGESYNPNITSLPHHEDFNNVSPPALPIGWTNHLETTSGQAVVHTSHLMDPNSPPYHVRFGNFIDPDANLFLISPEIEFDISQLRVSFYSRVNIDGPSYIEVGTWDPVEENFSMLASFHLTTTHTHFFYEFDEYEGDDVHIAFRADFAQTYRWVMLDDFHLDFAPLSAIINVTPDNYTFAPLQAGTTSAPKEFTIINDGGDTLVVAPSGITITGDNADAFILTNLEEEVQLLAGETAVFSVVFAPDAVGNKEATLSVNDFEVPLSGEAFDATITEFPWEEDFSGLDTGEIPFGWIKDTQNWGVSLTNNAGGQSPEMRFHFVPILSGAFYLQSPQINSSDYDELLLTFSHMVNNYQTPGIYTLKVVALAGDEEYLIYEWVDPDNIAPENFTAIINAQDHGVGAENLRIAFVFDGDTEDINQWYIDDIVLREVPEYYTATFNVVEDSPEQDPVNDVTISIAGAGNIVTDENGQASITLEAGSYYAEIIKVGYANQAVEFTLEDEDIAIDILLLDEIAEPFDLAITMEGLDHGDALLSWELETILHEFRYDDGEVVNQLGYPLGTINSVLGAAHHYHAVLHEMSWMTTSEGGPHNVVKLWVIGLNQDGLPNRTDVLYTAENVNNTDNEWNTYQFASPVEAPNGFYIGVSYGGFVGLALDNGQDEPWEYTPGTHFGIFNMESHESNFVDITDWDVEKNFLLRAYGDNLGTIHYDKVVATNTGIGQPAATTGKSKPMPFLAGQPHTTSVTNKAFSGFNIYLDDMDNPIAENIADQQYLFENLEPGSYTAGVRAMYTTGVSEIATLDFVIEEEPMYYSVTFGVIDEQGEEIHDAVITLNGETAQPGVYQFEELEAGTYGYSVNKEGYLEVTGQLTIADEDVFIEITLIEDDVAVDDIHTLETIIYPNPANLMINIESTLSISKLRVIDILGQIVHFSQPQSENYQLNVSDFPEGIYFVQILTSEGYTVRKIQIAR